MKLDCFFLLFLLLQLRHVEILLKLESLGKSINDFSETSSKILLAVDSLTEGINRLNTTNLEILAALDPIKEARKTIQEMDPAKKQVICPHNLLYLLILSLKRVFRL